MANVFKGGMDQKANAKEWAGGGKQSNVDTQNVGTPSWRGGAKDIADPYKGSKRAEGSQGSTKWNGRDGEPGRKDYACPAPVLGFSPSALHGHLGHYKNPDVLKKGHNQTDELPVVSEEFPAPDLGVDAGEGGGFTGGVDLGATPTIAPPLGIPGAVPPPSPLRTAADRMTGRAVRRTLRGAGLAPNPKIAAVRAERPVLAAKFDRRQAVKKARKSGIEGAVKAARTAGRENVAAARTSSNAAGNERTMRKQTRKAARYAR